MQFNILLTMFKKNIHMFQQPCYKALQNVIGITVRQ